MERNQIRSQKETEVFIYWFSEIDFFHALAPMFSHETWRYKRGIIMYVIHS